MDRERDTAVRGGLCSRRRAIPLMLGLPSLLAGAEDGVALRLAISDTLVTDVNVNDARAAMHIWIKRLIEDFKVVVELTPKVFETTDEIQREARAGLLDAVALNVVEYRQLAGVLDPSQVVGEADGAGTEQYLILVKRNAGIEQVGGLRGRRLLMLRAPKMCVAGAWLATLLDPSYFGQSERFFASVATDTKTSRVVLPVFFGQADACLTSKRGFDTMCELNPQVGKDLIAVASSPVMVVSFYVFRKNYRGVVRERFVKVLSSLRMSSAGRQLATLFQFGELTVRDASCLASALQILESSERIRRRGGGSAKGQA